MDTAKDKKLISLVSRNKKLSRDMSLKFSDSEFKLILHKSFENFTSTVFNHDMRRNIWVFDYDYCRESISVFLDSAIKNLVFFRCIVIVRKGDYKHFEIFNTDKGHIELILMNNEVLSEIVTSVKRMVSQNAKHEQISAFDNENNNIQLQSIFDNLPDVFFEIDENGEITEVSPSVEFVLGFHRSELIGKKMYDRMFFKRGSLILKSKTSFASRVRFVYEGTFNTKKNENMIGELLVMKTRLAPKNKTYGSLRDITEIKTTQIRLKESQDLFNTIVNYMPGMILIIDVEKLNIVYGNPNAIDFFQIVENTNMQFTHFLSKTIFDDNKNGTGIDYIYHNELVYKNDRGQNFILSYIYEKMDFNSRKSYLLILHDITEKRMTLNQNKKLISNSDVSERMMMSRVLHDDIGSMLSAVKMYAKAIEKNILPDDNLKNIINSMNSLINSSMDEVSKLAESFSPYLLEKFGPVKAIEEHIKKIHMNIDFHHKLDMRLDSMLENGIFKIVCSLLELSIKYYECTSIKINLSLNDNIIHLTYFDDGPGITELSKLENNEYAQAIYALKMINSRVFLLGGKYILPFNEKNGLYLTIQIPIT